MELQELHQMTNEQEGSLKGRERAGLIRKAIKVVLRDLLVLP